MSNDFCSKCFPDPSKNDKLRFCAECWSKWRKGLLLEEFIVAKNLPEPPKPVKFPYQYRGSR